MLYVVAVIARPWYAQFFGVRPTAEELRPGDIDTDVVYPVTFYPGAMDAEAAGRITLTAGESATADRELWRRSQRRVCRSRARAKTRRCDFG